MVVHDGLEQHSAALAQLLGRRVALRFLIARNGRLNSSNPILREAAEEGDIVFLNMTEAKHRCSLKYFLWFGIAPKLFPTAQYFVLGDDDVGVHGADHRHMTPSLLKDPQEGTEPPLVLVSLGTVSPGSPVEVM